MMKLSFIDKLANFYILVLIIGFLFIGSIPKLIGASQDSLSLQYRIVVLGVSLFLIINMFFSRRINKIYFYPLFGFLIFWVIYGFRVFNDLYVNPIQLYLDTPRSRYAQFTFGITLIPSIALLLIIQGCRINIKLLLSRLYNLLLLIFSITLFYRIGSGFTGRNAGDLNVGILSFGQFGATLSILSVYRLVKENRNLRTSLFYAFGFIVGVSGIFVSASKSPFLALVFVLLVFILLWHGSIKTVFLICALGILFGSYFIDIIFFLNDYFKSSFLDRLLYAMEVGGDNARELLIRTAFNEFIENPFLGNAMLIQSVKVGSYPHNLIVEALMATGAFGGGVFVLWVVKSIKTSFKSIKKHSELSWIALLFLQYLIFGMFSSNLYSSDLFWFFSIMIVSFNIRRNKDYKN